MPLSSHPILNTDALLIAQPIAKASKKDMAALIKAALKNKMCYPWVAELLDRTKEPRNHLTIR